MNSRLIALARTRPFFSQISQVSRTRLCASIHTTAERSVLLKTATSKGQDRVLHTLPLSLLVQTLTVLSVAALPAPILSSIIRVIRRHSKRIASSPLLSWPLRRTFYETFCIGENSSEIAANISTLRSRGITGVVLSFAREANLDDASTNAKFTKDDQQLKSWVSCNLDTIAQVGTGDYIAVKCTGAGAAAVKAMEDFNVSNVNSAGSSVEILKDALFEICAAAQQKNVKVMVDAESSSHQPAIDYLTLAAMENFNTRTSALVFNTYQMYLKSSLDTLKSHLNIAGSKKYVAGIKLVRGAYLYVEPDRTSIIQDNKSATDNAYDEAVDLLLRNKKTAETLDSNSWTAEIMLATHNTESVEKALSLYRAQNNHLGENKQVRGLVFAQLMGMADEISMKLANDFNQTQSTQPLLSNESHDGETRSRQKEKNVSVYKYTVWGTFEDCLLYMLRRAEENQDAVARSRVTAGLMLREIGHRMAFWK